MARTPEKSYSLVRLETFTDAVIAVAMTVMVLDLKAPQVSPAVRSHPFDFSFLHQVAPKLVAYAVSFFYVGMVGGTCPPDEARSRGRSATQACQ